MFVIRSINGSQSEKSVDICLVSVLLRLQNLLMRSCEVTVCGLMQHEVLRKIRIGSSLFLIISFQLLSLIGVCCITSYKVS